MENGALKSLTQFTRLEGGWEPGEEQRATCFPHYETGGPRLRHQAPYSGCSCGLYAFYDLDMHARHGDGVGCVGVVSAWGDLILCEYGFRAEYMRVEALVFEVMPGDRPYYEMAIKPSDEALAERYNVPLIDVKTLPSFLEELGGEILEPAPQSKAEPVEIWGSSYSAAPLPVVQGPPIVGIPAASSPPKPLRWVYWMNLGLAVLNAILALWQISVLVGEFNSPDPTLWRVTVVCVSTAINLACAWWMWERCYVGESVDG